MYDVVVIIMMQMCDNKIRTAAKRVEVVLEEQRYVYIFMVHPLCIRMTSKHHAFSYILMALERLDHHADRRQANLSGP